MHQLPSATIGYHQLTSATIGFHLLPSATICYHQPPSTTIGYHQLPSVGNPRMHQLPSATNGYHWLPSATICYHPLPSATISCHQLPSATISHHRLPLATINYHQLATRGCMGYQFQPFYRYLWILVSNANLPIGHSRKDTSGTFFNLPIRYSRISVPMPKLPSGTRGYQYQCQSSHQVLEDISTNAKAPIRYLRIDIGIRCQHHHWIGIGIGLGIHQSSNIPSLEIIISFV